MPDLVNNAVADEKTVQVFHYAIWKSYIFLEYSKLAIFQDGSEQKKTGLKFITNENLFKVCILDFNLFVIR